MKHERGNHIIIEQADKPNGRKGLKVTRPSDVVNISSKEELTASLKHYSKPLLQHLVPDSHFARKRYVERIRPALRYFCKKFGVKVPQWLVNDDYYLVRMSDEEKRTQFGTADLKVTEFHQLKSARSDEGSSDGAKQA